MIILVTLFLFAGGFVTHKIYNSCKKEEEESNYQSFDFEAEEVVI